MLEVIVRETREVQIEGRAIKIITEENIWSFKENSDFGEVAKKIKELIIRWSATIAFAKSGFY